MAGWVSPKFRKEVEAVSQDRLQGPIVKHYRELFKPYLRTPQETDNG